MAHPSPAINIQRKAILIPPILFALWLLTDDQTTTTSNREGHHLAAVTALRRHLPSLRVFRAIAEGTLLLFCVAFSLRIWEARIGKDVVDELLFSPPFEDDVDGDDERLCGGYELVESSHSIGIGSLSSSHHGNQGLFYDEDVQTGEEPSEDESMPASACDAEYASDGEVVDPQKQPGVPVRDNSGINKDGTKPVPSVTSTTVAGAAIDLLLILLVSLFIFTIISAEGGQYIDGISGDTLSVLADVAAPIVPLALFLYVTIRSILPWRRRKDFWTVISFTVSAPFCDVTFRDGFIGDILTSSVRPMQDIAFTIFYFFAGLQGWWSHDYGIDDAAVPVERSWLVHTVVMPACMISPLWWRFLQNLKQAYDNKQRWPYLGNAFKYFIAAEVALFGLFDPSNKQNVIWVMSFVGATLYQVWWDVFMDWELLVVDSRGSYGFPTFSLRPKRLYRHRIVYWAIMVVNFVLRFCWTLSFIPQLYLNQSGVLNRAFTSELESYIGPAIASAEIIRRSLWGLLRLELEAIKTSEREIFNAQELPSSKVEYSLGGRPDVLVPMNVQSGYQEDRVPALVGQLLNSQPLFVPLAELNDIQVLTELSLWATAFTSLGIVAAAHRETM